MSQNAVAGADGLLQPANYPANLAFLQPTRESLHTGLLPRLLSAALSLGMEPGSRSLHALLAACDNLDGRGGLGPFAYAAAPSGSVAGTVASDVLRSAHAALEDRNLSPAGAAGGGDDGRNDLACWQWGGDAERVAAGVLRTLAYQRIFGSNFTRTSSHSDGESRDAG